MNVFVLLTSLVFVAGGVFILASGRDATVGWMGVLLFGGGALIAGWDLVEQRRRRSFIPSVPVSLGNNDKPVVVKVRRTECLVYFLGSAGFSAGGVFMIINEKESVPGWVTALLFGLGSLVCLWQLLDPRPRLVIDGRGVYDRTMGAGWIDWSDIMATSLESVCGQSFLCLEVRDPDKYLSRLSRWWRFVGRCNRTFGFTELYLNLSGITMAPEQVARIVEWHLGNARAAAHRAGEDQLDGERPDWSPGDP